MASTDTESRMVAIRADALGELIQLSEAAAGQLPMADDALRRALVGALAEVRVGVRTLAPA